MILKKFDQQSIAEYLSELGQYIYKESGEVIQLTCIITEQCESGEKAMVISGGSEDYINRLLKNVLRSMDNEGHKTINMALGDEAKKALNELFNLKENS